MVAIVMVFVVVASLVPAALNAPDASTAVHNGATGRAEQRPFCLHAGRNPGNIGNGIAAQPHRIRRAGLTGRVIYLSRGAVRMIKQAASEQ